MATRIIVPNADLEGGVGLASLQFASGFFGNLTVSGSISAAQFSGGGSSLTGVKAAKVVETTLSSVAPTDLQVLTYLATTSLATWSTPSGGGDATSIRSVNVSTVAPADTQVLTYLATTGLATWSTPSAGGDVTTAMYNRLLDNFMLMAFRQQMNDAVIKQSMIYGFADEFEDESFVATGSCVKQLYNSTDDYYSVDLRGVDDSYTKVLLHCNGADNGTTFTDESGKTWTAVGNAKTSTTSPKFGTAAAIFDGTEDCVETPDHADFAFGAGEFTIDLWIKRGSINATQHFIGQVDSSVTEKTWMMRFNLDNTITARIFNTALTAFDIVTTATITDTTTWHHLAFVRDNTGTDTMRLFIDGVAAGTVAFNNETMRTPANKVAIGRWGEYPSDSFNGRIDEVRISKGIARWVTDFTPPTSEYAPATTGLTLVSNAGTAASAPTSARIVLFKEDIDTLTINTDLKAHVSRDNGTTYSEVTLANQGDYASSKQIWAGTVDISGQPSGTSPKIKVVSANNKNFKLHGWGVTWS